MSTPNPPIIISKGSGIISRSSSVRIPGTFSSTFRYGEQVVSTGVSSLDSFIGGGIPLGCVCIISKIFSFNDTLHFRKKCKSLYV